jgi:hypothetical protein
LVQKHLPKKTTHLISNGVKTSFGIALMCNILCSYRGGISFNFFHYYLVI